MTKRIRLELPKHFFFGPGIRERLPEIIKQKHYQRIVFLTGQKWFKTAGWQAQFEKQLKHKKLCFISCSPGEPDVDSINDILSQTSAFNPQVIVGVGGGSVIDTAKVCSVLLKQQKKVENFLEGIGTGESINQRGIPCIAMPTTAGTGAEATKNSVIKSKQHKAKKSIRSSFLIPEYVIADPEFTLQLDPVITGITGMDALVQLFESYVSNKANPVTRSLIKPAFSLFLQGLKKLAENGNNLEARTDVAYGAFISGVALANSGLGAVHGFASALGGLSEIPHGLICANFFQPVLKANKITILDHALDLLGIHEKKKKEKAFSNFQETVAILIRQFHLDEEFKKYPIASDMVPIIAEKASGSSMSGNPRQLSQQEKEAIIKEVILV